MQNSLEQDQTTAAGQSFAIGFALITFTVPANLSDYRNRVGLEFPVLSDPTRGVYAEFGFGRGSLRRIWGLRSMRRYLAIGPTGLRRMKAPTEDTLQLGGDVVIGPDGTIVYLYRSAGPDDRPPIDELMAAARGSRQS